MLTIAMAVSSASFLFFGVGCLYFRRLRDEFIRYGLAKWRPFVGILQLLGAVGLLVGISEHWAALISSGGLAILMLLGVCVRVKIKDSLLETSPAFSYMILNGWIFYELL